MSTTNDFLPFAASGVDGSDVLSQSAYQADADRTTGNQIGVARRALQNKSARQSSLIAAAVAQAVSDLADVDMLDDGTTAQLVTNIKSAITASIVSHSGVDLCPLVGGMVPSANLPSYVDDVIEASTYSALPTTGETGKIYVTLDTGLEYRWSGSIYVQIAKDAATAAAFTTSKTLTATGIAQGSVTSTWATSPTITLDVPSSTAILDGTEIVPVKQGSSFLQTTVSAISNFVKAFFSASSGASLVGFIRGETGAVAQTVQDALRARFIYADSFGVVGDGTTDNLAFLNKAISELPSSGGTIILPSGVIGLSGPLSISKPVILVGRGMGQALSQVDGATTLRYIGTTTKTGGFLDFNGNGTVFFGGGVFDLQIDAAGYFPDGLRVKDCQHSTFRNVGIRRATTAGLELTNTLGQICGFHEFFNLQIGCRETISASANGIWVNGITTPGADGTTLCKFYDTRIDHKTGMGVCIGTSSSSALIAGDNFSWYNLFCWANAGDGSFSFCSFQSASSAAGGHTFYSPMLARGAYFANLGANTGTRFYSIVETDLASDVSVMFYGPGVPDVYVDTQTGSQYGRGVIQHAHSTYKNDSMIFIAYDSTNKILTTADGAWKTAGSGTVGDAGAAGGAILLNTTAASATSITVERCANAPYSYSQQPIAKITINCLAEVISNSVIRVGFMDVVDGTTVPANGIYLEFDSSVSSYWRVITKVSGTVTNTTTLAIGPAASDWEWTFAWSNTGASVRYRASANSVEAIAAIYTSGIPTAILNFGVYAKTTDAVQKRLNISDFKLGHVSEGYPMGHP